MFFETSVRGWRIPTSRCCAGVASPVPASDGAEPTASGAPLGGCEVSPPSVFVEAGAVVLGGSAADWPAGTFELYPAKVDKLTSATAAPNVYRISVGAVWPATPGTWNATLTPGATSPFGLSTCCSYVMVIPAWASWPSTAPAGMGIDVPARVKLPLLKAKP